MPTISAILPLVIAFLTTLALVPQVRKFAIECRVADKPNGRKVHAHAIPHLGGVAIFSGFFLGLLVSLGAQPESLIAARILTLLPALLILFGLGLVDDLRGLRAGVKLTYQVLGAVCVVGMGAGFQAAELSGTAQFVLLAALSILWYVGVCNSMNLIDGLDGLAAGTATLAALGFFFVGWRVGNPAVVLVSLCLIGALAAFLRFNFYPARIFMGDTGSMFLGFTLASLTCLLAREVGLWKALLGGAAILGVPILDTASAICRRVAARRHIFQADGEHTHHRLMRIGLSHRGAVVTLYLLGAMFTVLGCGVLLGHVRWFLGAAGLGFAVALTVSFLARRAPEGPRLEDAPLQAAAQQGRVARAAEGVAVRVMPVSKASTRVEPRAEDVFAALPPAAGNPH